ncbi:MAG: nucleotidyltransferase family protein [Oscillospiraceae bacterium]|jgi:UTP-glucose-1-phosphate uridylyltransferase
MKRAALVIMAAGLGSRYGGNKQIDGIGPNGEILMEYSIYDAVRAGFTKIVFIIKPEHLETMQQLCGNRAAQLKTVDGAAVEVCYVFQDFTSLPDFYQVPEDRVKPFGTVHAVLCAKDIVKEPFAVINADDYYGKDAFSAIFSELMQLQEHEGTMVGYLLKNTISKNGTVTRGVCEQKEGFLSKVTETMEILQLEDGRIVSEGDVVLNPETLVSMNFWGFTPWIFGELERYFHAFLHEIRPEEIKKECYLPALVDQCITEGKIKVSVLKTNAVWFGMTYASDKAIVAAKLKALHNRGVYPASLR